MPNSFALAPSHADINLLGIVRMNEEIKQVVKVAFRINIMALNAIFLAKRAGTSALGFAVLSNELRVFSQDLRVQMLTLTNLVALSVKAVTELLQELRLVRLLKAATALAKVSGAPQIPLERHRQKAETQGEQLIRLRKNLGQALDDAFRLVELGGVLAKSAKIEAAYGQEFARSLAQVSSEFDGIVDEIRVSLEKLRQSDFVAASSFGRGGIA